MFSWIFGLGLMLVSLGPVERPVTTDDMLIFFGLLLVVQATEKMLFNKSN